MTVSPTSTNQPFDLLSMIRDGFMQQADAIAQEGLDISSLPPAMQQIIQENEAAFQEGALDKLDSASEVRSLIDATLGGQQPGMQQDPGMEALRNMNPAEMIQMLIDWIMSGQGQNEGEQAAGAGPQDLGNMNGQNFTGSPQPTSWNPASPGASSPGASSPGASSPGASSPGASSPGASPTSGVTPSTPGGGGEPVDRLFQAITGQESNGNHSAVNADSGALGIGQVMPANIASWSKEALGYEISKEQFADSPDLQNQIVRFKLDQYLQEGLQETGNMDDAVRWAAAKWYSGKGSNMNSTRPQSTNGNSYPSISAYTHQVLDRFRVA